jgi:uncharacterized protein YaiE (UPF0345 family)
MKSKEEIIDKLLDEYPTAKILRRKEKGLSDLLQGEFNEKINVYKFPKGRFVVSRPLINGLEKDSTVGIIMPGKYDFNTGENTETMTVLSGILQANVGRSSESELYRYGSIIAPAGSTLHLLALTHVYYLCQYKPKKKK